MKKILLVCMLAVFFAVALCQEPERPDVRPDDRPAPRPAPTPAPGPPRPRQPQHACPVRGCSMRRREPTCGSDGRVYPYVCARSARLTRPFLTLEAARLSLSLAALHSPPLPSTPLLASNRCRMRQAACRSGRRIERAPMRLCRRHPRERHPRVFTIMDDVMDADAHDDEFEM